MLNAKQLSLFDSPLADEQPQKLSVEEIDTDSLQKVYYTTTEVAAMFQVNTSLLRFWEKEFPKQLGKVKKNKKGDRYYSKKEIEYLKKIYYLVKEKRLTLQGAREILKHSKQVDSDILHQINTLKGLRQLLLQIKQVLK